MKKIPVTAPQPSRLLTILAQDPSVRNHAGRVITASVPVPNEHLSAGPRGYRVQVVDYDASSNRMYIPLDPAEMGSMETPTDPFCPRAREAAGAFNQRLLADPRFHAQNAYAIVMRTLAHFERALGRRISWSFGGHQLKVAPHAFAEANAFYSPQDEGLLFGYFAGSAGTVYTCLSHDIVAHETTHALLDGLRPRYMEPSSTDQAAFHEGFADVIALLSVFSIPEVVLYAVRKALAETSKDAERSIINLPDLTIAALKRGILLGLGEQFGEELEGVHGAALRRSVMLKPSPHLKEQPEYQEEHQRGELLVAMMLEAFLNVYRERLSTLGREQNQQFPRKRVAEEGADIADRMLTMSIRALDYMPPTDIEFGDFLSALLTSDVEIRPDDSRYHIRAHLREAFRNFGFAPASRYTSGPESGLWQPPLSLQDKKRGKEISYSFVHREGLQSDRDEVFRFLWDNRTVLGLCDAAYTEVCAVRPCLRVDQDGFTLRETVADYVQILTVRAGELENIPIPGRRGRIRKPAGLGDWKTVRLLGGGALLFDEFGHLKYHIRNALLNPRRQTRRLEHLTASGFYDGPRPASKDLRELHMRGMRPEMPLARKEALRWE